MKKCIAFVPGGPEPQTWRQCRSAIKPGFVFCRNHERVLAGIVLGICVYDYPDEAAQVCRAARDKAALARLPVAARKPS